MNDETQANPLELLARYRALCEAAGAARATDGNLPKAMREQLAHVETELQTRLWLASAEKSSKWQRNDAGVAGDAALSRETLRNESAKRHLSDHTSPIKATVYCDGACLGNPGPGGYCAIVHISGQPELTVSGSKTMTTNNEMELTAAIEGLKVAVSRGAKEISIVSDSEYLIKGMSGWIKGWIRNGWKTSKGEPVKNRSLWEELYRLSQGRSVTWNWIRGHGGHPENERCDAMAVAAAHEAGQR